MMTFRSCSDVLQSFADLIGEEIVGTDRLSERCAVKNQDGKPKRNLWAVSFRLCLHTRLPAGTIRTKRSSLIIVGYDNRKSDCRTSRLSKNIV